MSSLTLGKTLGILGGGQLGRMLIQAAVNFNIRTKVLDPDPQAPCAHLCDEFVVGSFADYETVYQFGKMVDQLTVEIEHVNLDALKKLEAEGVIIFPQPEVLEIIQDKGTQKQFFHDHQIPTADFQLLNAVTDLKNYTGTWPVIQKLRRLGYDGKGVTKLVSLSDTPKAFIEPSILEQCVDIQTELAVIVARSVTGELVTYSSVEMQFHPEVNLVEFLIAPARITPAVDEQARALAIRVAEALQIVGVLAVELFLTKTGEVLVNEIAPRPHNSGHHTIEANVTSQYEQHLRAILGWPLGDTATRSPAVMVNLLGEPGYTGPAQYQGLTEVLQQSGVHIHLYGKAITKPMRKMGHVTIVQPTIEQALATAQLVKNTLKIIS